MPIGTPASTLDCIAARRLAPSCCLAAVPVDRQTMHQQLLGPPRLSKRPAKSGQFSWLTSRKTNSLKFPIPRRRSRASGATPDGLGYPVAQERRIGGMADRGRFELTVGLHPRLFSRPVPYTTRPPI